MVDAELGLTVAFNGCIYNYPALREELTAAGYRFFSTSDTEVIAQGLPPLGHRAASTTSSACSRSPSSSATSGRLVLARDRLGIKPLYLAETPGRLRFASTLPALLAAGDVDTSLDRVALHHYMSFHSVVPAPRTILSGVASCRRRPFGSSSPTAGHRGRLLAPRTSARPGARR